MATVPFPTPDARPDRRGLPEYMPARMVNEFVYCPLFLCYEWVDGPFRDSADTVTRRYDFPRSKDHGPIEA